MTTDEVINVADDDSGDEFLESSSQSGVEEISNDEETNTSVTTDTDATNGRGQQKRRGPRTRGDISRVELRQQPKKRKRKLWMPNGKNKTKHQQSHPSQAILK